VGCTKGWCLVPAAILVGFWARAHAVIRGAAFVGTCGSCLPCMQMSIYHTWMHGRILDMSLVVTKPSGCFVLAAWSWVAQIDAWMSSQRPLFPIPIRTSCISTLMVVEPKVVFQHFRPLISNVKFVTILTCTCWIHVRIWALLYGSLMWSAGALDIEIIWRGSWRDQNDGYSLGKHPSQLWSDAGLW